MGSYPAIDVEKSTCHQLKMRFSAAPNQGGLLHCATTLLKPMDAVKWQTSIANNFCDNSNTHSYLDKTLGMFSQILRKTRDCVILIQLLYDQLYV